MAFNNRDVYKSLISQQVQSTGYILGAQVKSLTLSHCVIPIGENCLEYSSHVVLVGCDLSCDLHTSLLNKRNTFVLKYSQGLHNTTCTYYICTTCMV